jgi:hypothetical protein
MADNREDQDMSLIECRKYHALCTEKCDTRPCLRDIEKPGMAWGSFCKIVFYGRAGWPHNSEWIVPGTITDEERV